MNSQATKTAVVIVAAGRGSRADNGNGPKQYQFAGTKSVLNRTMQAFVSHQDIDLVIVVIHGDDEDLYHQCACSSPKILPPVLGGATRQLSVFAGLQALIDSKPDRVLIHDAARPYVDDDTIDRVLVGLQRHQAVLPAIAVSDTLKRTDDHNIVVETVSRDGLFAAQTPQGFEFDTILMAHLTASAAKRIDFTDDTAIAEWHGVNVGVVEGSVNNIKLTTAQDMINARKKSAMPIPDIRVGHGYDTHQFVDGDRIYLCGVELVHNQTLKGHSDADVGLHALTDALLATVSSGDIGSHFPPSDPKWRAAKSDQFLQFAVARVEEEGGHITHLDVTLVCEAPKIGPHRDAMRQAIADISGIEMGRISVKATTNESRGFIGRGEGMVAIATATVVMGNMDD